MKVDELDMDIIWAIKINGSMTTWGLSKVLKTPEPKIRYRVLKLLENGWVKETNDGYVLNPVTTIVTEKLLVLIGKRGFWVFTKSEDPKKMAEKLKRTAEEYG